MKKTTVFHLMFLALVLFSCSTPVSSYKKASVHTPYDVIIVPGIPYQESEWTDKVMKARVLWSYLLYSKGITRHIIYSGNAVYSPYIEGRIMALYAQALGVPPAALFSETKAEHSTENLVFSYRMARKLGFERIAVATDPYQSALLESYAWNNRIPVDFIPIVFDTIKTMNLDSAYHIDPSSAYVPGFISLPQRENFITRGLGTMGLDIQETVPE